MTLRTLVTLPHDLIEYGIGDEQKRKASRSKSNHAEAQPDQAAIDEPHSREKQRSRNRADGRQKEPPWWIVLFVIPEREEVRARSFQGETTATRMASHLWNLELLKIHKVGNHAAVLLKIKVQTKAIGKAQVVGRACVANTWIRNRFRLIDIRERLVII